MTDLSAVAREAIRTMTEPSVGWLASAIGKHRNTVDGYLNQGREVPPDVAHQLMHTLEWHAEALLGYARQLAAFRLVASDHERLCAAKGGRH
jgi:plasmid maintenance system antidote protein VapI